MSSLFHGVDVCLHEQCVGLTVEIMYQRPIALHKLGKLANRRAMMLGDSQHVMLQLDELCDVQIRPSLPHVLRAAATATFSLTLLCSRTAHMHCENHYPIMQ
jgi:hypothetical protein